MSDNGSLATAPTHRKLDSQQIELVGKSLLVTMLLADGVEVAEPRRDRGVDLVAFIDIGYFKAVPLQIKAYSDARFGVDRKYERFPDLRLVHLWNVHDRAAARAFCMTFPEARAIAAELGWTATQSWERAGYSTKVSQTSPAGRRIIDLLAPYEVTNGGWFPRLFDLGPLGTADDGNVPPEVGDAYVLESTPCTFEFAGPDGDALHFGITSRVLINFGERLLWLRLDDDEQPETGAHNYRPHHFISLRTVPGGYEAVREDEDVLRLTRLPPAS